MDPQPAQVMSWIQVVFYLGAGLAGLTGAAWGIIQLARGRQPPIEAEYATKAELADLDQRLEARLEHVQSQIRSEVQDIKVALTAHNGQAESRASNIHKRIDDVFRAVDFIRGRCAAFHGREP